jgi:hypothetical protein
VDFFEAAAAGQGLETCRTVMPDFVLLDYRLPDMTGLDFLTRLRAPSGHVAVKAIKAGRAGLSQQGPHHSGGVGAGHTQGDSKGQPAARAPDRARPFGSLSRRKRFCSRK